MAPAGLKRRSGARDLENGGGGGTFSGGPGNDAVTEMTGGTFDGGVGGTDSVATYIAGTCIDVEVGC